MIHYGPCSEISMKWKILHFKVMFVKTDHLIEYLLCYVCKDLKPAFRIHLILTSIRIWIRGSTFGKSGSGSSDPPFRIRIRILIHFFQKWIRIRFQSGSGSGFEYLFFIFFKKKFMSDKLECLFILPPKFGKGISQITKTFSFTFYSK